MNNANKSESGKLVAGRLSSARTRPGDSYGHCLLDQIRLVKSLPGRPERIQASFAQYDPGLLRKNGTKSDAGCRIRHSTIQPRSGCMLAVVKTLLNWIRNVYWAVMSYRQFGRDVIMMSSRQVFWVFFKNGEKNIKKYNK